MKINIFIIAENGISGGLGQYPRLIVTVPRDRTAKSCHKCVFSSPSGGVFCKMGKMAGADRSRLEDYCYQYYFKPAIL